jgi:CelD/BcsL family acetyltransferase involved in cellulose biosynthesis
MFNVYTLPGAQLGLDHINKWRELLRKLPWVDSPYFQPEFTRLVASVRGDVEVAFIEAQGELVGVFPFQRGRFGRGKPVGGRLSDFHGIIGDPRSIVCLGDLLSKCRLRSFHFDHLLLNHFPPASRKPVVEGSPYIGMPGGFSDYIQTQRMYSKHLAQYQRKLNKLVREHGETRFVFDNRSEHDFQQLLRWKQEQYQRTGAFNPLRFPWTLELLRKIWNETSESFRGIFSTFHVGDQIIGAHFGMRSHSTLHYWFPAYDPEFQSYSPGNLMLLEIARAASEAGITKIDLGKGSEEYKLSFGSAQTLVAEGCAYQPSLLSHIDSTCQKARTWLKGSAFNRPMKATARVLRPLREWLAFR